MKLRHEFALCVLGSFVLGSVLLGSSCESDDCTVSETRCNTNTVEICGSDHNWHLNMDCNEIGSAWVCCWMPEDPVDGIPEGHGCLPSTCPVVDVDAGADIVDAVEGG